MAVSAIKLHKYMAVSDSCCGRPANLKNISLSNLDNILDIMQMLNIFIFMVIFISIFIFVSNYEVHTGNTSLVE